MRTSADNSDAGIKVCSVEGIHLGKTNASGQTDLGRHQIANKTTRLHGQKLPCILLVDHQEGKCNISYYMCVTLKHACSFSVSNPSRHTHRTSF